jgi:YHS domain-containing protein
MLGWALRIILLLIVVRLVVRFVAGLMQGLAGPATTPRATAPGAGAVPLVRDPVCGTYVVKGQALPGTSAEGTAWFCSERCRDQWRATREGVRRA